MKQLMIAATIVGFISLVAFGVIMASASAPDTLQVQTCPNCPVDGAQPGSGVLHDFMTAALAKVLGIDEEEFIARRAAGETLFDIAADLGIGWDDLVTLRSQARLEAIELAYQAGVLTDEQYQFFLDRVESGWGMGFGGGMHNGGGNGQGGGFGRGQHGGGMGNQDCPYADDIPED